MHETSPVSPPKQKSMLASRSTRILAALIILAVLILALLPFAIRYGVERALVENGAEQAQISDVDFNVFTGQLEVEDLSIDVGDSRTLNISRANVDVAWWPLFNKRAVVQGIQINDALITIEQSKEGKLKIAGLSLIQDEQQPEKQTSTAAPWEFAVDLLRIRNTEMQYSSPDLSSTLYIADASLTKLESWKRNEPAHFSLQAKVNDSPLDIQLDLAPFSDEPQLKGSIKLSGLALTPFAQLAAPMIAGLKGTLTVDINFDVRQQGDDYYLAQQGKINIDKFHIGSTDGVLDGEKIAWDGQLSVELPKEAAPKVQAEGRIQSAQLDVKLPEPESISVMDLSALDIQDIVINGINDIKIASVDINNLSLLKASQESKTKSKDKAAQVLKSSHIKVATIKLSALNELDIDTVSLKDVNAFLHRDKKGQWYVIDDVFEFMQKSNKPNKAEQSPDSTHPEESKVFSVAIASINFANQGQVRFEDESLQPAYRNTVTLQTLTLNDLDTRQDKKPAGFKVVAKIGKYSQISLDGEINPLASRLTMAMTGDIKSFELPPLSSFTAPALGYNMAAGTMNADIKLDINNGQIDGVNKLTINNIKVTPDDEAKMEQLTTQLTMPLDVALSTLRDKNNNIHLEIPITGDIADPKFNISDVINTAMGKAMKFGIISFLKKSLQPFGTLITVVEMVGKAAAHVSLEPVSFAPGDSSLDDNGQQYLERISSLMKERPELRLRLCGWATENDRNVLTESVEVTQPNKQTESTEQAGVASVEKTEVVLVPDEQLQILAGKRAELIKDKLVSQHDIEPDRLFVCHPEIDKEENSLSRVDVLI